MKKLLILSLALATLVGCADADYGHTASNTGTAFRMVRPAPVNGNHRGIAGVAFTDHPHCAPSIKRN
jgi:hypothetical protein